MSQVYSDAQIIKANGAEFYYILYADGRIGQGGYDTLLAVKEGKLEQHLQKCKEERYLLGIGQPRMVKAKTPSKKTVEKPKQLSLF